MAGKVETGVGGVRDRNKVCGVVCERECKTWERDLEDVFLCVSVRLR